MSLFRFGLGSSDPVTVMDAEPIRQYRHLSIGYNENLQYQFSRSQALSSLAAIFCDIDGDGAEELCVCSLAGELAIFKVPGASQEDGWNCCVCPRTLGSIVCLSQGHIRNDQITTLVAVSAEGMGYLFEWESVQILQGDSNSRLPLRAPISNRQPDRAIFPLLEFTVPYNVSAALVTTIGTETQLVIGTTDRTVHALKYQAELQQFVTTHQWNLREQVVSLCESFEVLPSKRKNSIIVVGLQNGLFARISLHTGLTGVSYAGSNYENQDFLDRGCSEEDWSDDGDRHAIPLMGGMISDQYSHGHRNSSLTLVAGPLCDEEGHEMVVCGSYEGVLSLQRDSNIVWDINLGHPIFSIQVADITGNGTNEIIVATYDGYVFLCDHDRHVVSFRSRERGISAMAVSSSLGGVPPRIALIELSEQIQFYTELPFRGSLSLKPLLVELKDMFQENSLSEDWSVTEKKLFIESTFYCPLSSHEMEESLRDLQRQIQSHQQRD